MSLITPDFGLFFWMTLIFAIVFFILAKFGFPVITGMVDERTKRINESIAKAKEAEQSLAGLAEQQTAMIQEARKEQSAILKEASEQRDKMIAAAREDAAREAAKLVEDAKAQIAAQSEAAMRDIRRQVSLLSVEVAEKIIRKEFEDPQNRQAYIDSVIDEVFGDKSAE